MTNKVFFDSNILIYLYSSDEPQKKCIVEKIIDEHQNVFISTQVLFEFVHVTRKKMKFEYANIETALKEFKDAFTISIIYYETLESALKIADKYKYSFVDSLIISAAIENGCTILFSEDMHSEQLIEKTLTITNPFKK